MKQKVLYNKYHINDRVFTTSMVRWHNKLVNGNWYEYNMNEEFIILMWDHRHVRIVNKKDRNIFCLQHRTFLDKLSNLSELRKKKLKIIEQ